MICNYSLSRTIKKSMKEHKVSEVCTIDLSDEIIHHKISKIKLALDKFIDINEKISENAFCKNKVISKH